MSNFNNHTVDLSFGGICVPNCVEEHDNTFTQLKRLVQLPPCKPVGTTPEGCFFLYFSSLATGHYIYFWGYTRLDTLSKTKKQRSWNMSTTGLAGTSRAELSFVWLVKTLVFQFSSVQCSNDEVIRNDNDNNDSSSTTTDGTRGT